MYSSLLRRKNPTPLSNGLMTMSLFLYRFFSSLSALHPSSGRLSGIVRFLFSWWLCASADTNSMNSSHACDDD